MSGDVFVMYTLSPLSSPLLVLRRCEMKAVKVAEGDKTS
jgi:hypothetical protein